MLFSQAIHPLFRHYGGTKGFSGKIVTVKCFEDNSLVKEQAALNGDGKVLVVDGGALDLYLVDGDAYATPLGEVRVDKAFAAQLAKMSPTIQLSSRGHTPTKEGAEHAIEVQLPWLQRVLGDFELVPIVMGEQGYEKSRALGVALAKLIQGQDTLIVASSDLSHYHPYDDAVKIDHKTLNALQEWDYFSMSNNFQARIWEACGGAPIVAAMIAAERMGANEARVLKYANTGDVTGDHSRVVGYSADVLQPGFALRPEMQLIQKPYLPDEILRRIHDLLNHDGASAKIAAERVP